MYTMSQMILCELNLYLSKTLQTRGRKISPFDEDTHLFETRRKTHTVPLYQVPKLCSNLNHCNINTITQLIGEDRNFLHPENSIFFQIDG